jgi:RNA polymerase sigma-70 factor (ECF subfamily)
MHWVELSLSRGSEEAQLASRPDHHAHEPSFVECLRADPAAAGRLFDDYAQAIERVLVRVLGCDPEVPDLLQDVFLAAMTGIVGFRGDAQNLGGWLTQIAVRKARKCIRRRKTRRLLGLVHADAELEGVGTHDLEMEATLRRAYEVLDRLPARERIPFSLRFIAGMQLNEVADACDVSLATIKRRLSAARRRFDRLAASDPMLSSWVSEDEK